MDHLKDKDIVAIPLRILAEESRQGHEVINDTIEILDASFHSIPSNLIFDSITQQSKHGWQCKNEQVIVAVRRIYRDSKSEERDERY